MRTRQNQRVATDTWRSLGCRTTPLKDSNVFFFFFFFFVVVVVVDVSCLYVLTQKKMAIIHSHLFFFLRFKNDNFRKLQYENLRFTVTYTMNIKVAAYVMAYLHFHTSPYNREYNTCIHPH